MFAPLKTSLLIHGYSGRQRLLWTQTPVVDKSVCQEWSPKSRESGHAGKLLCKPHTDKLKDRLTDRKTHGETDGQRKRQTKKDRLTDQKDGQTDE
jgi:hypothetical protein